MGYLNECWENMDREGATEKFCFTSGKLSRYSKQATKLFRLKCECLHRYFSMV